VSCDEETVLPSYQLISVISLLSSLAVPPSLWQSVARVQDLFRTPRYRDDIGRGSRTCDTRPRSTWRTRDSRSIAVPTIARRARAQTRWQSRGASAEQQRRPNITTRLPTICGDVELGAEGARRRRQRRGHKDIQGTSTAGGAQQPERWTTIERRIWGTTWRQEMALVRALERLPHRRGQGRRRRNLRLLMFGYQVRYSDADNGITFSFESV
jgi:hypothetical protein